MQYLKAPLLIPIVVTGLLTLAPAWHSSPTEVDLALVLAVDVSTSMDPDEQDLQRQGYVETFRSPLVHQAIRTGMLGRIAVTYVEWAGAHTPGYQSVIVPWTVLETPKESIVFAERLAHAPTHRVSGTSISKAIDFSMTLFSSGHFLAARRVIDISGDGANNQGRPVTAARDEAVAQGITINGLPIMLKRATSYWDVAELDRYYRECVIGGPGAFMEPVRERQQFADAIKTKIIREIAAIEPGAAIIPARAQAPLGCITGDLQDWDLRR